MEALGWNLLPLFHGGSFVSMLISLKPLKTGYVGQMINVECSTFSVTLPLLILQLGLVAQLMYFSYWSQHWGVLGCASEQHSRLISVPSDSCFHKCDGLYSACPFTGALLVISTWLYASVLKVRCPLTWERRSTPWTHTKVWRNHGDVMLSGISQPQKDKHCVIPHTPSTE